MQARKFLLTFHQPKVPDYTSSLICQQSTTMSEHKLFQLQYDFTMLDWKIIKGIFSVISPMHEMSSNSVWLKNYWPFPNILCENCACNKHTLMRSPAYMPKLAEKDGSLGMNSINYLFPCIDLLLIVYPRDTREADTTMFWHLAFWYDDSEVKQHAKSSSEVSKRKYIT